MGAEHARRSDPGVGGWLWSAVAWTAVTVVLAVTIVAQTAEHAPVDSHGHPLVHLGQLDTLVGLLALWAIGLVATVVTGRTITRRTTQRHAIDRSYRQLFEALPDGTFVLDWHGGSFGAIREVNAAACRMLSLPRYALLGSWLCDVFADCTPDLLTALASAIERGGHVVVEQRLLTDSGSLPVQAELYRFESAGRPAVLLILKDLGDRQAAEWALRRRDTKLAKLSSATRQINEDLRERTVLRRLVSGSMEVLGATEGMAGLFAEGRIEYEEYADLDGFHPLSLALANGEGVAGVVWDTLAIFRTNDGPRELPSHPGYDALFRPVSVLAAPIIGRDGIALGCVEVHDKASGEAFDEDDGLIILGLAASAAVALENAGMLQEQRTMRQKLLDREERLRRLAGELTRTEEQARRHIAEGLHDRIGQELAVMRMRLGQLGSLERDDERSRRLDDVRALLDRAIADTRALTFEISPPMLYTLGLAPALEWLCEQLEQQHGVPIRLQEDVRDRRVTDDARALLYISIRELLMNIVKHSAAAQAEVRLTVVGEWLWAAVVDDGIGFAVEEHDDGHHGFGLFSIRERLRGIGGEMLMRSAPGEGTEIVLEVPLEAED